MMTREEIEKEVLEAPLQELIWAVNALCIVFQEISEEYGEEKRPTDLQKFLERYVEVAEEYGL